MATVFFLYVLGAGSDPAEFERRIMADVAPRALAEESVAGWTLHRGEPWPGTSDDGPDYVCVVEVESLERWAHGTAESISESHGGLGPLVHRIQMVVAGATVRSPGDGAHRPA